jgi:branched-chain amino acid transport system ATP-binding protein
MDKPGLIGPRTPLLWVNDVCVSYAGIRAVKSIGFEVHPGECVSLIGSNGAGKTTTLKALTRLLPIERGEIELEGQSLLPLSPWDLVAKGIVMVPEGRGIFARMSVQENLKMGAYLRLDAHEVARDEERMYALFPRLKERRGHLGGHLSGGEQQMLAMARALMAKPRLLILDEPSMGLSPIMVEKIFEVIRRLSQEGMTILLVEQNATQALMLADRAYVIESGLVTMSGQAQALLHDPLVRQAYLGA